MTHPRRHAFLLLQFQAIYLLANPGGTIKLYVFVAIFGVFMMILAQLPSFHSLRHVNLVSLLLCLAVASAAARATPRDCDTTAAFAAGDGSAGAVDEDDEQAKTADVFGGRTGGGGLFGVSGVAAGAGCGGVSPEGSSVSDPAWARARGDDNVRKRKAPPTGSAGGKEACLSKVRKRNDWQKKKRNVNVRLPKKLPERGCPVRLERERK